MRGVHHVLAGYNLPERQFHCSVRPAASDAVASVTEPAGPKAIAYTTTSFAVQGSLGPLQGCAGLLWIDPDTQYMSVKH